MPRAADLRRAVYGAIPTPTDEGVWVSRSHASAASSTGSAWMYARIWFGVILLCDAADRGLCSGTRTSG